MSYALGNASKGRLATCHRDIQIWVKASITFAPVDFTVTDGYRGMEEQERAFELGNSKAHFGQSPHNNHDPVYGPLSLAVDLVPYIDGKLDYENDEAFEDLQKHLRMVEKELLDGGEISHTFDWGGAWSGFVDRPHWQLKSWRKYYDYIQST